jgi:hypothetical protein
MLLDNFVSRQKVHQSHQIFSPKLDYQYTLHCGLDQSFFERKKNILVIGNYLTLILNLF